jgi:hypothetical protein
MTGMKPLTEMFRQRKEKINRRWNHQLVRLQRVLRENDIINY